MVELHSSFVSKSFLRSVWSLEYEAFKGSSAEAALATRLRTWADRKDLKETAAEAAFIQEFFRETWGYGGSGQVGSEDGSFTLWPKFAIAKAGEKGGTGAADLAIGIFHKDGKAPVLQAVCEFKDIRSDLDAPQRRKGNNRSPVRQCLDYLSYARRGLFPSDPVQPTWGIVTDMNEFRLYWFDKDHRQSLRFTIRSNDLFKGLSLIADTEAARFDRFLFAKVFHRETLISPTGRSLLVSLVAQQRFTDRKLEDRFYGEYRAFRERLYLTLLEHNAEGTPRYPGTRGRLVRLAQKILDRFIFVFFCEDMGQALAFPPKLLQEFLTNRSNDPYFDENGTTIWGEMIGLFRAMDKGKMFGGRKINPYNGGLFAEDPNLDRLYVPNSIFCRFMQGANEANLYTYKDTLLYLCASYNYASDLDDGDKTNGDPSKSLGLYTLGRIFEQSITELEILEAEAEGRPSVNKESKRKRDGVYYTPEWVVERIVDETLGPLLTELKTECGWRTTGDPTLAALDAYAERLKAITVLDPACGSGAFLITTLRYLVDAWHEVDGLRRQLTRGLDDRRDDAALISEILTSNIYGVDINASSVEIARLALWLHTARGDRPLSSLDANVREGNSLIGPEFFKGQIDLDLYDDAEKERVNAFDWHEAFPAVFAQGGFDAVVGNPPYVKLQNFRHAHPDMAAYLREGRDGAKPFKTTQTGNFDLYLPFIEKGLAVLNMRGRLGYIAPSLWISNEYGKGLRDAVAQERTLDRWVDFKSFQVFEEATTYTSLQFFTKMSNDSIRITEAPRGDIPTAPWVAPGAALPYGRQDFGERWLLLTGVERALIDRLAKRCKRLDAPKHTSSIFVGIQTSADAIYHLRRLGPGRYLCTPDGKPKPPPYEVKIEDALMKPLVSGAEAKRYVEPITDTYLLFPYRPGPNGTVRLIDETAMRTEFPKAWGYLTSYEDSLRGRENGKMDIETKWWGYVYPKGLDKQEIVKLVVPRLVLDLVCNVDEAGRVYLDNVDVGGVVAADGEDPFYLAGVLNSRTANFVFRRVSKPFRGSYLSANKQFIAPLPIPLATTAESADVAARARALQTAYTLRRDVLSRIARRLATLRVRPKPETWLFPSLKTKKNLVAEAPSRLEPDAKRAWAEKRYETDLAALTDAITPRLLPGAALQAAFADGELTFSVDTVRVVESVFAEIADGEFIVAQWKVLAATFTINDTTNGRKLVTALRRLALSDNPTTVAQVIALEAELSAIEVDINEKEYEMNALVDKLYGLTDGERQLVAQG